MVALAVFGLLLVGLVVYTIVNGELRLPFGGGVVFAFPKAGAQQVDRSLPPGTVGVYACPRALPAYTQITREHLLTQEGLHTVPVVEQAIAPNGLFPADVDGLRRLLGRVLRRDKPVNYAFTEKDFLPEGTRPGPSAGIPPGMRGIWLDATRIQGLADARAGDLVDLVAAKSVEAAPRLDAEMLGNLTDPVLKARVDVLAKSAPRAGAARSWVVARGALVITPVRSRELGTGGVMGKKPATVEEAFVAMAPAEVATFSQALAQDVTIIAAPRSGQPEASPAEIRDSQPVDPAAELRRMLLGGETQEPSLGMVEVIRGGAREMVTVPRASKGQDGR